MSKIIERYCVLTWIICIKPGSIKPGVLFEEMAGVL